MALVSDKKNLFMLMVAKSIFFVNLICLNWFKLQLKQFSNRREPHLRNKILFLKLNNFFSVIVYLLSASVLLVRTNFRSVEKQRLIAWAASQGRTDDVPNLGGIDSELTQVGPLGQTVSIYAKRPFIKNALREPDPITAVVVNKRRLLKL